ncbi:MAG: amphi-Trp domain-containing protein [Steroidobacteraceae bacterium]|jgi:amphi-Trp domain-containing protein|nr:amphi-Trp domain-containing protein [Steroidobacteraceae bacterium]
MAARSRKKAAARGRDVTKGYPRAQFVAKLRRLADALETGEPFVITVAGERIHVPARARFTIEHERAGDGEEVEFQLTWTPQP